MEFTANNYKKMVELFKIFGSNEKLYDTFYANDYPIPYKNLTIYPVQVDLYVYFHSLVECLLLPHLTSGDANAISMSYLDYLAYLADKKGKPQYLYELIELLLISLKMDRYYLVGEKQVDAVQLIEEDKKWILLIQGEKFNGNDFDKIRKIICEQNAIEMIDESIHPDKLKAYKEMEQQRLKQNKIKMCSFEDQINIVVAQSGIPRYECVKMTIRSFSKLLERIDKIMHYELYTILKPNMDKKDQEKIPHYMEATKSQLERYKDLNLNYDEVKNKFH